MREKKKNNIKKNFENPQTNKRINDCIRKTPNETMTKLSDIELNDEEITVLKFNLKYGLFIRPKENEMIAVM